jgi:large subunit ribosomal protein L13
MTEPTKTTDIKREWHLVDVGGKILGREATNIAQFLMGKNKPYFARNMDCGDFVVVVNAATVKLTGNKEKAKLYTNYSGYPGGLRTRRAEEVRAQNPTELVTHAVSGMLPHNRLHDKMLTRLYVFADANHTYQDKFTK